MGERERTGQSVGGNAQLGQQTAFAALQERGIGTRGCEGRRYHLIVIIQSDKVANKNPIKCCFAILSMGAATSLPWSPRPPTQADVLAAFSQSLPQNC